MEALIWAIIYGQKKAGDALEKSLGSKSPKDIYEAISTFDLSSIDEETMSILSSFPTLVDSNLTVDCWHLWAEDNENEELDKRLSQVSHPGQTACDVALRVRDPAFVTFADDSGSIRDIDINDDMIVCASNPVRLLSSDGNLLETLPGLLT